MTWSNSNPSQAATRLGTVLAGLLLAGLLAGILVYGHALRRAGTPPAIEFTSGETAHGRLSLDGPLPVLTLDGLPAEMGRAHGELLSGPLTVLRQHYLPQVFRDPASLSAARDSALGWSRRLAETTFIELNALAVAADIPAADAFLMAQVLEMDAGVHGAGGLSLAVESTRSRSGAPLLAQTLDLPGYGLLGQVPLLIVARPNGKLAYATLAWPGQIGVIAGVNEAGLAVALNVAQGARRFPRGMPGPILARRILESATDIDAARQILSDHMIAAAWSLTLADATGRVEGAELTPLLIRHRQSEQGLLWTSEHFLLAEPREPTGDVRYRALGRRLDAHTTSFSVDDLSELWKSVAGNPLNLQAVIIEPIARRIHISARRSPAAYGPYVTYDLAPLFAASRP